MAITDNIELGLIAAVSLLFCILFYNISRKIISILPIRVNCWFCNSYCWVKIPKKNCWTCPRCEQYNGFTNDGDYNKPMLYKSDTTFVNNNNYKRSPPRNGLCKMCNVNQQLKVTQLANFVPMNEWSFDEEIDSYRLQLEKAYKLCSPCKKVVQKKLHKEKEVLLGSKVLESKTPEKKILSNDKSLLNSLLQNILKITLFILLILIAVDLCKAATKEKNYSKKLKHFKNVITQSATAIYEIIKMKCIVMFPQIENYAIDIYSIYDKYKEDVIKYLTRNNLTLDSLTTMTQETLGGVACLLQISGHLLTGNKMNYAIVMDLVLMAYVALTVACKYVYLNEIIVNIIKLSLILILLRVIRSKNKSKAKVISRQKGAQKKLNYHTNNSNSTMVDEDSNSNIDSDDDVSLAKFGVHNFSDSSNENKTLLNSTVMSGRAFAPSIRESKLNTSLFKSSASIKSSNSFAKSPNNLAKSPNSFAKSPNSFAKSPNSFAQSPLESSFAKPTFWKYQKSVTADESDSDLDESISSLYIGSPKKGKDKTKSIFSLRKFTATPLFATPNIVPMSSRPVISPSKLGHATSWVAGGYWGPESERKLFIDGSRSSSQSSGFESQASSANNPRLFSQPPSRAESVYGEYDKNNANFDLFSNFGSSQSSKYAGSRINVPVYPQMQYNSHVLIPQPRLANATTNPFAQSMNIPQPREKSALFKLPSDFASKLPQTNPFYC